MRAKGGGASLTFFSELAPTRRPSLHNRKLHKSAGITRNNHNLLLSAGVTWHKKSSRPPSVPRHAPSLPNHNLPKTAGVTRHNHIFPSTVNAVSRPSLHNHNLLLLGGVTRHKKFSRPPPVSHGTLHRLPSIFCLASLAYFPGYWSFSPWGTRFIVRIFWPPGIIFFWAIRFWAS